MTWSVHWLNAMRSTAPKEKGRCTVRQACLFWICCNGCSQRTPKESVPSAAFSGSSVPLCDSVSRTNEPNCYNVTVTSWKITGGPLLPWSWLSSSGPSWWTTQGTCRKRRKWTWKASQHRERCSVEATHSETLKNEDKWLGQIMAQQRNEAIIKPFKMHDVASISFFIMKTSWKASTIRKNWNACNALFLLSTLKSNSDCDYFTKIINRSGVLKWKFGPFGSWSKIGAGKRQWQEET